jgi:hypothetical protein
MGSTALWGSVIRAQFYSGLVPPPALQGRETSKSREPCAHTRGSVSVRLGHPLSTAPSVPRIKGAWAGCRPTRHLRRDQRRLPNLLCPFVALFLVAPKPSGRSASSRVSPSTFSLRTLPMSARHASRAVIRQWSAHRRVAGQWHTSSLRMRIASMKYCMTGRVRCSSSKRL